jgi:hypothetical protein
MAHKNDTDSANRDWTTPDVIAAASAVAAFLSFLAALWTVNQSAYAFEETTARELLRDYFDAKAQHPNVKPYDKNGVVNNEYGWIALRSLSIAETLYLQQASDDPTWEATAAGIVKEHSEFASDPRWKRPRSKPWFDCDYYSPSFVRFMESRRALNDPDLCADAWGLQLPF